MPTRLNHKLRACCTRPDDWMMMPSQLLRRYLAPNPVSRRSGGFTRLHAPDFGFTWIRSPRPPSAAEPGSGNRRASPDRKPRGGPVSLVELPRSGVGGDADDAVVVIEIDLGAAFWVERDGVCAGRRFGEGEFLPVDGIEEPEGTTRAALVILDL